MRYCRALRERQAIAQAAVLRGMGIEVNDILVQVPMARMLKPSYAIVCDRQLKTVVLAIRGTHSLKVRLHTWSHSMQTKRTAYHVAGNYACMGAR